MRDGRKVCAELCEVSRLALYLARLGQEARLHHAPLFSRPFLEDAARSEGLVRESTDPSCSYGKQPPPDDRSNIAKGKKNSCY